MVPAVALGHPFPFRRCYRNQAEFTVPRRPSFASLRLWVVPAPSAAVRRRNISPYTPLRRPFWDGAAAVDILCCVQASAACSTGAPMANSSAHCSHAGGGDIWAGTRRLCRAAAMGLRGLHAHMRLCFGWHARSFRQSRRSTGNAGSLGSLAGELPCTDGREQKKKKKDFLTSGSHGSLQENPK
jgi:hypothetical protein